MYFLFFQWPSARNLNSVENVVKNKTIIHNNILFSVNKKHIVTVNVNKDNPTLNQGTECLELLSDGTSA